MFLQSGENIDDRLRAGGERYIYTYIYISEKKFQNDGNQKLSLLIKRIFPLILGYRHIERLLRQKVFLLCPQ